MCGKAKIGIPASFYSMFFLKLATTHIYTIFATEKAKMAKSVLDKKAPTAATAPVLQFLQAKKQK